MRARALTLALAVSIAAPAAWSDAATAQIERTFLERTAIAAADKTCNLFTDGERFALKSGLFQSEGELLRAGYSRGRLEQLAGEVRAHAKSLGCDHPSVLQVAGTIRSSYRQFAKTTALEYPAASSMWAASRSEHDVWAVKQTDKASDITLGLRREDEERPESFTLAVAIPWTKQAPSAVQLYMRDQKKMIDPWLPALFGPGAKATPPARSISRPEWAGRVEEYEDNVGDYYLIYYFAPSAIERLELLDPRETVQLELTPSPLKKDKTPVRVNFEVGDVRAARAFALIPKPPVSVLAAQAAAEAAQPAGGGH